MPSLADLTPAERARLLELHRSAGFLTVEVEPFDELSKTGDGTPIQRHYHLAIATR